MEGLNIINFKVWIILGALPERYVQSIIFLEVLFGLVRHWCYLKPNNGRNDNKMAIFLSKVCPKEES